MGCSWAQLKAESTPVFHFIVCSCLLESLAMHIGKWEMFLAELVRCQPLVPVIICALCLSDGHMHIMNRLLFSIKIIPSSSSLLTAKLYLCPTELCASRQLTGWGPKDGILIVSRESTSSPFKRAGTGQLSMTDDEQIEGGDLGNVAVN